MYHLLPWAPADRAVALVSRINKQWGGFIFKIGPNLKVKMIVVWRVLVENARNVAHDARGLIFRLS